jgi:hypothetical protein
MKTYSFGLLCVLVPLASGCSVAPAENGDPVSKETASAEATVLAQVKLSASHDVQILENVDGIVSIVERGAIGADKPIVDTKAGPSASLVALYEQLQTQAADPAASKVDMARLKTLDGLKAVALASQTNTAPPQEQLVKKASSWANYLAPNFTNEWNWWSNSVCNRHTDRCEMGLTGDGYYWHVNNYATYSHFNMSTNSESTMTLWDDPCYNAPFWSFCTKPIRNNGSWTVPAWSWGTISSYGTDGGDRDWSPEGNGNLWSWAVTYDNPRTW